MNIQEQISAYIDSQPEAKRTELQSLHQCITEWLPNSKQWFLDGKDENGKTISNPQIGYGSQIIHYANGTSKEFFQIGISANSAGFSVYIMGLNDKKYLPETYGKTIGKATVTSYCIKFKTTKNIHMGILKNAIMDGVQKTSI